MPSKNGRRNLKPLPAKYRAIPTISEYLQNVQDYDSLPGKIKTDGSYWILFHGRWIPKQEFDSLLQKPFIPDFSSNLNNVDKTNSWMFDK